MTAGTLDITIEQGASFEKNLYVGIGYRAAITSYEDAGGGLVKAICTLPHNLTTSDKIIIQDSVWYSGTHTVTVVDTTSFTFPAVWEYTELDTVWVHPKIFTGHTAESHVRKAYTDTDALATMTATIVDGTGGHVRIELDAATTRALPRLRKSYWDLEITETATGFVTRLLQGKAIVTPEATK